jgi:hypothetical protein
MNTANFDFGKTKSGLPASGWLRRQPLICAARNKAKNLNSVVALPELRIRDIKADRDNPPNGVLASLLFVGQRFMALLQLVADAFARDASELWRHGVSNHIANRFHVV